MKILAWINNRKKKDKESLILLLWSPFNESLFMIKKASFGFQEDLSWYKTLIQFQTKSFSSKSLI